MPIYRYACQCGNETDEFRKIDSRNDELICRECNSPMTMKIVPSQILPDIQPYQALAIDKETGIMPVINGRKQHREFLKRNDYVEASDLVNRKKDNITEAPMLSMQEMKRMGL